MEEKLTYLQRILRLKECGRRFHNRAVAVAVAFLSSFAALAAEAVRAELRIPPKHLHVIGDPIPLIWRFENQTSTPLGFMWEGCCRLNGRLSVERDGVSVSSISASNVMAHMFAKAERLLPGLPREFDTKLSDWVAVQESGLYHIQGRYVGVLPQQHPQVPRGLLLWTNAARTGTIEVKLLKPDDYLARRSELAALRGVNLAFTGPARLSPLEKKAWTLEIQNLTARAIQLQWPSDFSVWILDDTGARLTAVKQEIDAGFEELEIAARGRLAKAIEFDTDFLEGERLGHYRIFADLKEGASGESRTPSNAIPLEWNADEGQVFDLLNQAAGGANVGIRNRPLKVLRIYLGQIRHHLEALKGRQGEMSDKTRDLHRQLSLAASLQSIAPKPGRVILGLRLEETGEWVFQHPVAEAAAKAANQFRFDALNSFLRVRRHLGWEVGLAIFPQPNVRMQQAANLAAELSSIQGELAAPVGFGIFGIDGAQSPSAGNVTYDASARTKGLVVRMLGEDGRGGIAVEGSDRREFGAAAEFEAWLGQARLAAAEAAEAAVLAPPRASWGDVMTVIGPLRRMGLQVRIGMTESPR